MHVTSLELADFRNYRSVSVALSPGVNVLAGGNGQGKTNFLEAAGLLSVAKSLRGATDTEMVGWSAKESVLTGHLADAACDRIEMSLRPPGRKRVSVDGAPLASISDLIGILRTVQLAPDAIEDLFRSASGRRRMLDMLISQVDRTYLRALIRHRNTIAQLNALLRQQKSSSDELGVWEEQVSVAAVEVVRRRRSVVERLEPAICGHFAELFGGVSIEMRMRTTLPVDDSDGAVDACARALAEARPRSRQRGFVSKGAHRDRVEVLLGGRNIEEHASQGQFKGAFFAWKIGEGDVIEEIAGVRPVWIVDDPFSEMDRARALKAFEMFSGRGQVLITTARDDDLGIERWDCTRWRVESGTIEQV